MGKWPLVSLGSLAAPNDGAIAIGPFGSAMKADTYTPSGVPIIRGTNISSGRAWKGDWVFIPPEFADAMPRCVVKSGSLVFPHRGSIGEIAIVPNDEHPRYFLSTSLMKIDVDEKKANALFVYFFFRSQAGRNEILKYASQVGTPGIGQPLSSLRQFKLPSPPISIQNAIASILGALEDKIDLNRRMNGTLEAMARTIFKDWFVDFGPTRAKMQESATYLAPEIWTLFPGRFDDQGKPENWENRTLGEEAAVDWGNTSLTKSIYVDSGFPAYSAAGQDGFVLVPEREGIATVVSAIGTVGKLSLAHGKWTAIKNTITVQSDSDARSAYLHFALSHVEIPTRGSTQQFIALGDMRALKITLPCSETLSAFGDAVLPLLQRQFQNDTENRTLAACRDLLLPKLMSGEICIREAEKTLEVAL